MYKLLIVDDEAIEREYLQGVFREDMPEISMILSAANGQIAMDIAMKEKPHIIIMDVNMPLLDGLSASALIRKALPDSIILINSAYSEFEFAQRAINLRLDGYLLKPAKPETIIELIRTNLARKHSNSHVIHTQHQRISSDLWNAADRLVDSFLSLDDKLIESETNSFMAQLEKLHGNIEIQRLFVINSLFRLQQACQSTTPLLSSHMSQLILSISQEPFWQGILDQVSTFFIKLSHEHEKYNLHKDLTTLVKNYLDAHFHQALSLVELAEQFSVSPTHLSKKFSEDTGIPLSIYLRELRLNEACRLLRHSTLPISTVATMVGFHDIPHFNRLFRSHYNMTPSAYRKDYEHTSKRHFND